MCQAVEEVLGPKSVHGQQRVDSPRTERGWSFLTQCLKLLSLIGDSDHPGWLSGEAARGVYSQHQTEGGEGSHC